MECTQTSVSQPSMFKFTTVLNKHEEQETIEEIVAKLIAKDGFTISGIARSEFIRQSIKKRSMTLPQQPSDVMNLVFKYYNTVKEQVVKSIQAMKLKNKKFTLSIDEWTSFNNRRYLNVHLYHDITKSINLGLIPVLGSCPAEKMVELVNTKLVTFGLSFERDIVATVSDGASVMLKYGTLSPALLQTCYNHAIHLAVVSALYTKIEVNNNEDDENNCSDNDDEELDDGECLEDEDYELIKVHYLVIPHETSLNETIRKMRKIVKIFRKSPVKNVILQRYVIEIEEKELQLVLDCKTRWNTLEAMVARFLRIRSAVVEALQELNLHYIWSESHSRTAIAILDALKPVRIAIEALSRNDATLLTGEGVLKFLFDTLKNNNTDLSKKLLEQIRTKIEKRRNSSLVSLMKFLQNPTCIENYENGDEEFFKISSKTDIVRTGKSIMVRLFPISSVTGSIEQSSNNSEASLEVAVSCGETDSCLTDQLAKYILESKKVNKIADSEFKHSES